MGLDIKITHVRELPSMDVKRRGEIDTLVIYSAGADTGFTIRIPGPMANVTESVLREHIANQLAASAVLVGKQFTI